MLQPTGCQIVFGSTALDNGDLCLTCFPLLGLHPWIFLPELRDSFCWWAFGLFLYVSGFFFCWTWTVFFLRCLCLHVSDFFFSLVFVLWTEFPFPPRERFCSFSINKFCRQPPDYNRPLPAEAFPSHSRLKMCLLLWRMNWVSPKHNSAAHISDVVWAISRLHWYMRNSEQLPFFAVFNRISLWLAQWPVFHVAHPIAAPVTDVIQDLLAAP